jgi:predicted small integral membrane protein
MLSIALAGVLLLASTAQAVAHHSGAAEFDVNSHIELTGVVTKVEWTNPHAHFYVDVADAAGKVANWNLELASPNVLVRNGWTRHSLKEGDKVSVSGLRAKDHSTVGHANTITFPDGRQLNFGSGPGN